jgi:hypothetical protein
MLMPEREIALCRFPHFGGDKLTHHHLLVHRRHCIRIESSSGNATTHAIAHSAHRVHTATHTHTAHRVPIAHSTRRRSASDIVLVLAGLRIVRHEGADGTLPVVVVALLVSDMFRLGTLDLDLISYRNVSQSGYHRKVFTYGTAVEDKVLSLHGTIDALRILECYETKTLVSARLSVKHDMSIDNATELSKEFSQAGVID